MTDHDQLKEPAPWPGRYLLYAGGLVMLFVGLRGILHNTHGWENPPYWAGLLVAGAVGHDLILAPLVFALAVLLMRLVPAAARPVVASGLVISGVLALIALPGIRGTGRRADNTTILPLDYAHGLVMSLVILWLAIGIASAVVALRRSRRPSVSS